jgi:hypothetical protein
MSFGLYTQGDYSQVLISTESDTPVFIGKATFVRKSGNTELQYYAISFRTGATFFNYPLCSFFEYTFDSGGRDAIFFVYAPYPNKCCIAGNNKSGNIYSIVLCCQQGSGAFTPELYAFAKTNSAGNTGSGISVYRSNGSTAFTSKDKILLVKGFYDGTIQYSNLQEVRVGDGYYVGNSPNYTQKTITYLSPTNPLTESISKPIVYVTSPQSTLFRSRTVSRAYFYELIGAFNNSTKQMEIEWGSPADFLTSSSVTPVQSLARNGFFMVANGADYD